MIILGWGHLTKSIWSVVATAYLGGATAYLVGGATAYLGGCHCLSGGLTVIIRLVSVQVKLHVNCQLELSLAI